MITKENQEFIDALLNRDYILISLTRNGQPRIIGDYGLPVQERSEWMTREDAISDNRYRNDLTCFPFTRQMARFNNLL